MELNEYLARALVRDRMREAETWARGRRLGASPAGRRGRERRWITDLGRLALVVGAAMVVGIGVVGLWTAATEPRPRRAEVVDGLSEWDRWVTSPEPPEASRSTRPLNPRLVR
jgi:hypothetical protein